MPKVRKDDIRERRIDDEIVVDAYDEYERCMGWHCYLSDRLSFPFPARCTARRATSPLNAGDEVRVVGMASEEDCEREMLVNIRWEKRTLAVPLAQLEVIEASEETREGVEDWRYWVEMGYQF